MRTLLRSSFALAGVAAVTAVAGCAAVRPSALTVNGTEISRSSVDDELQAIADNPGLKEQISSSDGTIKSSGSTIWLTQIARQPVVDREVRRRHITVTAADRRAGQAQAQNFFGPQVFTEFPQWFRDRADARFSRQQALLRATGTAPSDADVRAAYTTAIAQLQQQCPSGRFVSHILVPSQELAAGLAAQVRAGTSFETLASQQSTDRSSAINGGALGCIDGLQLDPQFQQAASTLPLNQVSAPVQTQFGWHVILVRDTIPFELLQGPLRQRLEQQSPEAQRRLDALVARADVDVDPRYGRWVVRGGRGNVVPPRGAPATADGDDDHNSGAGAVAVGGRIVVVGLGPAGADHVLPAARRVLEQIPNRYVRTSRHPAVGDLAAAGLELRSFDDDYDAADDLDDVYDRIAAELLDVAATAGEVAYAVPGNPAVAERSVELLRDAAARGDIVLEIVPGLSFAELAWARLGVDPMAGARLADARHLTAEDAVAGRAGPRSRSATRACCSRT